VTNSSKNILPAQEISVAGYANLCALQNQPYRYR
jgi:hypothetical protein